MAHLSSLSAGVLCDITALLHYLDVANLYFAGFGALNSKLSHGGIAELTIVCNSEFRVFAWPSFVSQSRSVTRLTIEDRHCSNQALITSAHLETIPRNVKEMKLRVTGAFQALQDVLATNRDFFPVLEYLEVTSYTTNGEKILARDVHWPQSMLKLSLPAPPAPYSLELDPSSLPPNLTSLEGEFHSVLAQEFPRSLTLLRLTLPRVPCDLAPLLPSGLQELSLSFSTKISLEMDAWAAVQLPKLPRGLTTLHWPLESVTATLLHHLPPELTSLTLSITYSIVTPEQWILLPPNLTRLEGFLPAYLPIEMIKHMPKNLTDIPSVEAEVAPLLKPTAPARLSVQGSSGSLKAQLKALQLETLSPFITSLDVSSMREYPLQTLPKCLVDISLQIPDFTLEKIQLLPRTLKDLNIVNIIKKGSIEAWKALPKNLKLLELSSSLPSLPIESSAWLPSSLESLSFENEHGIPLSWLEGLPVSLRSLHVSLTLPSSTQPCIPPNLTSLTVRVISNQKTPIHSVSRTHAPFDQPTSSTSLSPSVLNEGETKNGSNVSPFAESIHRLFLALPRALETLIISNRALLPSSHPVSDLGLLPKRLKRLNLVYTPGFDVEEARKLLPKSLIATSIGGLSFS